MGRERIGKRTRRTKEQGQREGFGIGQRARRTKGQRQREASEEGQIIYARCCETRWSFETAFLSVVVCWPDEARRRYSTLEEDDSDVVGHERKYDELLDPTEREAQQAAAAKHVLVRRASQATRWAQSSLRRERMELERLVRSLECQIC